MIYSDWAASKTGLQIPLFDDGKPMHSKYDPIREAKTFAEGINSGFIVVLGIGGAFHIKSLLEKADGMTFVLAVEADRESLDFCKKNPLAAELEKDSRILFCHTGNLKEKITLHYLPAVYDGFSVVPQRAWETKCANLSEKIQKDIKEALSIISADFSVQSHFGKIWQRNICINLSTFNGNPSIEDCNGKTAAVIAAGPSLDLSISELKEKRDSLKIFSTDTAYGPLLKNGIIPDFVVSIDAQHISRTHFTICPENPASNGTVFVFDLGANPDAVRHVSSKGYKIFFASSSHPLSMLADTGTPLLENGAGTVTIAAADFARQLGAKKIVLYGADFSYNRGKPYANGTYLERNFYSESGKLSPAETKYDELMFRAPLHKRLENTPFSGKLENPYASEILENYEKTQIEWCRLHSYELKDGILENTKQSTEIRKNKNFSFIEFHKNLVGELSKLLEKEAEGCKGGSEEIIKNPFAASILPFIAFLRKNEKSGNKVSFFALLKLAYSQLTRYNVFYEK